MVPEAHCVGLRAIRKKPWVTRVAHLRPAFAVDEGYSHVCKNSRLTDGGEMPYTLRLFTVGLTFLYIQHSL